MSDLKLKIAQNKLEIVERENEILRERVLFLENLFIPKLLVPVEWELSPSLIRVLEALLGSRGTLTKENYDLLLYSDRHDGEIPDPKIVDVHVHKLRKAFKKVGVPIEIITLWGNGYQMPTDSIEYLRRFIHTPNKAEYESLKSEQRKTG